MAVLLLHVWHHEPRRHMDHPAIAPVEEAPAAGPAVYAPVLSGGNSAGSGYKKGSEIRLGLVD